VLFRLRLWEVPLELEEVDEVDEDDDDDLDTRRFLAEEVLATGLFPFDLGVLVRSSESDSDVEDVVVFDFRGILDWIWLNWRLGSQYQNNLQRLRP
jgi:hypothetical protein